MSKKQESALSTEVQPTELALPADMMSQPFMPGSDKRNRIIRRLAMFQGTATEQAKFPDSGFKRGEWIDVLEARKISDPKIVPVAGELGYAWWPKGQNQPDLESTNPLDPGFTRFLGRPPQPSDTEWTDEAPKITTIYHFVVILVGEPNPYVLSLKKTSENAGKVINTATEDWRRKGKIPVFRLGVKEDRDPKGNVFMRATAGMIGTADPDTTKLVVEAWPMYRAKVAATSSQVGGSEGDVSGSGPTIKGEDIPFD